MYEESLVWKKKIRMGMGFAAEMGRLGTFDSLYPYHNCFINDYFFSILIAAASCTYNTRVFCPTVDNFR